MDDEARHTPLSDAEILRLENQLCFALYAATRAITRTYREELDDVGLTYPQFLVLLVLWESEGLTVSQIGRKLMLDSGTLTPLLKRLENLDFVTRERSEVDEREVRVTLTERGRMLRDAGARARRNVACRLGMSETEIGALRREIMDLIGRLREEADEISLQGSQRRRSSAR